MCCEQVCLWQTWSNATAHRQTHRSPCLACWVGGIWVSLVKPSFSTVYIWVCWVSTCCGSVSVLWCVVCLHKLVSRHSYVHVCPVKCTHTHTQHVYIHQVEYMSMVMSNFVWMHGPVYDHTHSHVHTHVNTHTHTRTHTHTHTRTHAHTHTHWYNFIN